MFTVTLNYTPALIKKAAFAYVQRGFGTGRLVALGVFVASTAILVLLEPTSWFAGVACGAGVVLVAFLVGVYVLHYRQGMAKLQRMGQPQALLELTDAEFRASSSGGSFSTPWSTFKALWRFREFWLLIIGNGQFITLPLADLNPEAQAFISARVTASSPGAA